MLIAIFLVALLVISLSVAAPKVARSIQRDRDVETFHRGMQYRRAIQLYYRKMNHMYPPNVEALINTNNVRFLRKKYLDPMTGKDDWKPIAFGQNKTPTAMGFFGQPLAGNASTIAGTGPGGNGGLPGTQNSTGGYSGSGFGSGSGSSSGNSIFGSSVTSGDQTPSTGGSVPTDGSGSTPGATGSTGTDSGTNGQTFGGAGIIGFSPASDKTSILVYKKKQHYNEWEFTYDPLSDTPMMPGGGAAGLGGQPGSNPASPTGPSGAGGLPPGGPNPTPNSMPPDTTPQQ